VKKNAYIPRNIESHVLKAARQSPVVVLTGLRQAGKTTLLRNLFEGKYNFVSFEDPIIRDRVLADPNLFLERLGKKVVMDEIQYVPELLPLIKMAVDRQRNKRGMFIMTGSQQFNLMKNLSETLAGRVAILNLFPFEKGERKMVGYLRKIADDTYKDFVYSSLRGNFPELVTHRNISKNIWYSSYVQTYLERDIKMIYDVGSIREFSLFLKLLAARCSQVINLSSIAHDIGVAVNTVKRWFSLLEASNVIYLLYPYYRNLGKRVMKSPKVYFMDLGLVTYLTGIETEQQLVNGPLAGALFENYCIEEVVKCIVHRGIRPNIFYLRTHNQLEIDLIIERGVELYPVEIKFTKTPVVGMANPITRFKKIFSKLNIKRGTILTLAKENYSLTNTVGVSSLDNFLSWLCRLITSSH